MQNKDRPVKILADDPIVREGLRTLLEAAGYEPQHDPADASGLTFAPRSDRVVPLSQLEDQAIDHALRVTGGRVAKAAKLLGIGRATLYRRLAARSAMASANSAAPVSPKASASPSAAPLH